MKTKQVVTLSLILIASLVHAQGTPSKPNYPPAVQKLLSDVTDDDSQIILSIKHGEEEVRLATQERNRECIRRGKQYRFAMVIKGADFQPGCWMLVPGSQKVRPDAIIRLENGRSFTVPLRTVVVEAG
ncbi:hypothetical protein LJR296_008123 [Cupriavidus necator]|uniref:hypothetical protein n=1 Tax=Cupriavidus necator TaxID=106590 RepID=UPI003ECFDBF9